MARHLMTAGLLIASIAVAPMSLAGTDTGVPVPAPATALPTQAATVTEVVGTPVEMPVMPRIGTTEQITQITGAASPNDTASRWDIHGTDLGHMFWHEGSLYMVFGDTFGAKGLFGRKNWRSNTMARIADPDPRNGLPIEAMIAGKDGRAKELLVSRKIDGLEMTVIPTYGVSVGSRMFLHYMSVKHWGEPGKWEVRHSGIAYSDDHGQNWTMPRESVEQRAIGFEQVAFVSDKDMLYSFGIPEGRFGGVKLRRVVPERLLVRDDHEYWNGSEWVADPAAAETIVPGPVGELSVAWSQTHQSWLMMYLEPEKGAIMLRTARQLTGPWSEAQVVVTRNEFPGLYGPYIVPGSEIDGEVYYTLSQWDPYNVYLMKTALTWDGIATVAAPATPIGEGTVEAQVTTPN